METCTHAHLEVLNTMITKRLPDGDQSTPGSRFG